MRVRSWITTGVFVVVGATAASGCSSGDDSDDPKRAAAWKVCEAALGAENAEAAEKSLGDTTVRVDAPDSFGAVTDVLLGEAKKWAPGELLHDAHEACRMDTSDDAGRLTAQVKWSAVGLESVRAGEGGAGWRKAAENVYVEWRDGAPKQVSLLVPCAVPGAPPGQKDGLPLEVGILRSGERADDAELQGRLAAALARTVREGLKCADPLTVPATLPGG